MLFGAGLLIADKKNLMSLLFFRKEIFTLEYYTENY
jgi:hypothetical protein